MGKLLKKLRALFGRQVPPEGAQRPEDSFKEFFGRNEGAKPEDAGRKKR